MEKSYWTYYTLPWFNMSCNENRCIIYDNWCFKIGLLWFFSFNYVLWSHIFGWFNRMEEAILHPKKVIRIMAKALERKLSGSLFKLFSTPPTCQWTYIIITVSQKNKEKCIKTSYIHTYIHSSYTRSKQKLHVPNTNITRKPKRCFLYTNRVS